HPARGAGPLDHRLELRLLLDQGECHSVPPTAELFDRVGGLFQSLGQGLEILGVGRRAAPRASSKHQLATQAGSMTDVVDRGGHGPVSRGSQDQKPKPDARYEVRFTGYDLRFTRYEVRSTMDQVPLGYRVRGMRDE